MKKLTEDCERNLMNKVLEIMSLSSYSIIMNEGYRSKVKKKKFGIKKVCYETKKDLV